MTDVTAARADGEAFLKLSEHPYTLAENGLYNPPATLDDARRVVTALLDALRENGGPEGGKPVEPQLVHKPTGQVGASNPAEVEPVPPMGSPSDPELLRRSLIRAMELFDAPVATESGVPRYKAARCTVPWEDWESWVDAARDVLERIAWDPNWEEARLALTVERLREALKTYGQHSVGCPSCPDCRTHTMAASKTPGYSYCTRCGRGSIPTSNEACDCGFEAALAGPAL